MKSMLVAAAAAIAGLASSADAFVCPAAQPGRVLATRLRDATGDAESEQLDVESFLKENYPLFEAMLSKVPNIYATLRECDGSDGYTIFAPSSTVMESVDEKRKVQISDPRNSEVTEKLASYHVIANGKVTQERLKREDWTVPKVDGVAALSIGGVLTLGGELRVGRSKSGGFLGFGAKEDGNVVIGNNSALIIKSTKIGNGVIHEVDNFVAPDLIWRYYDQLRIPGF